MEDFCNLEEIFIFVSREEEADEEEIEGTGDRRILQGVIQRRQEDERLTACGQFSFSSARGPPFLREGGREENASREARW